MAFLHCIYGINLMCCKIMCIYDTYGIYGMHCVANSPQTHIHTTWGGRGASSQLERKSSEKSWCARG